MEDRIESAVPNAFYDLIVFVSPALLFAVGLAIGFAGWPPFAMASTKQASIGAVDAALLVLGLLFGGYEYGRLAEALSAPVVQWPLKKARRILGLSTDFSASMEAESETLGLPGTFKGSKWTVYFFANLVAPNLGRDLIKRYAWEKLCRSSAFTFQVLLLLSLLALLPSTWLRWPDFGPTGFGSAPFTSICVLSSLLLHFEYYKRNCWNNDLLRRVLPVLRLAGAAYGSAASRADHPLSAPSGTAPRKTSLPAYEPAPPGPHVGSGLEGQAPLRKRETEDCAG